MIIQLLLLLVLFPLADFILLLLLGKFLGFWPIFGLALGSALVGVWLGRRQWRQMGQRAQQQLARNEIPGDFASEALLIILTSGLLITPGVLSDLIGLTLLWPGGRRWYQTRILNWLRSQFKISVFRQTTGSNPMQADEEILEGEFRRSTKPTSAPPLRIDQE